MTDQNEQYHPDYEAAFMEWHTNTEWVQNKKDWPFNPLGMHRVEVMNRYIEHLENNQVPATVQKESVAFVDANGDLIAKTKLAPWTNLYTHPAQLVHPAGAKGEAVDLRELFERLLFGTYAGKNSYYNDEQIKHGCFERAQELVDVAKRMNIELYTHPAPAVAVNEQLLEALKHAQKVLNHNNLALDCVPVNDAIRAAAAEKANGGV